jgi:hypothetical protein
MILDGHGGTGFLSKGEGVVGFRVYLKKAAFFEPLNVCAPWRSVERQKK